MLRTVDIRMWCIILFDKDRRQSHHHVDDRHHSSAETPPSDSGSGGQVAAVSQTTHGESRKSLSALHLTPPPPDSTRYDYDQHS